MSNAPEPNPKIDERPISFETYVKFSLLGKIDDLEVTMASLKKDALGRVFKMRLRV